MSDRPGQTPAPGLAEVRQDAAAAAQEAKNRAGEAAETVRAHASQLASEATEQGREVLGVAQQRAEGMIEEGKRAGAEQARGFARAIHHAAEDLEQSSPEIARHVRGAADAVEGIAASLRERSAGELFDEVTGFARRQPAAFFGAAALVGFALARFAKSSSSPMQQGPSYGFGGNERRGAGYGGRDMPHMHHSGLEHHDGDRSQHLSQGATRGEGGSRMVPGWTPDNDGRPSRPATMSAASLGGAAAHRQGQGQPGSMPTDPTAATDAKSTGTDTTDRAGTMTKPSQGASL